MPDPAAAEVLSIPVHAELSDGQVEIVATALAAERTITPVIWATTSFRLSIC